MWWKFKKSYDSTVDVARLLNAFPSTMQPDVEKVISILPFDNKVKQSDGQIDTIPSLTQSTGRSVILNGEQLTIPYRIYFNEPKSQDEVQLTNVQKNILNCVYLCHHNGFIRQKRLELLIEQTDSFIIPYTFQLLGEYVVEILPMVDKHIDKNPELYNRFIKENHNYYQQTESRMISYWNEYYRATTKNFNQYIGKRIFCKLKNNLRSA